MADLTNKKLATAILKALSEFLKEFEGSKTTPNVVLLSLDNFNCLRDYFPYLIDGLTMNYSGKDYRVIITKDTAVGLAFSYHTDFVLEYV